MSEKSELESDLELESGKELCEAKALRSNPSVSEINNTFCVCQMAEC